MRKSLVAKIQSMESSPQINFSTDHKNKMSTSTKAIVHKMTTTTKEKVHEIKAPLDRFSFDDFLDADILLKKIINDKRRG